MIEGNLEDISLPGLLQVLASESTKNYRLRISKGGQRGDIFVLEGRLLVATFGILEGLDALSEFLNWVDGEFVVEKLPSHFKSTIRSNINLNLAEPGCFSDQCAFLAESHVGLNTEIVPSRSFGTAEWQEALRVQPLGKEDYVVLGWITDGHTMRQAMREFQFDLKQAIGILYRLLITRSVEVVRPTLCSEPAKADELDLTELANRELARHTPEPGRKRITVEFQATDIGGARATRPRVTADDTANVLPQAEPVVEAAKAAGAASSGKPADKGEPAAGKTAEAVAPKAASKSESKAEPQGKETAKTPAAAKQANGDKSTSAPREAVNAKPIAKSAGPGADETDGRGVSLFDRIKESQARVDVKPKREGGGEAKPAGAQGVDSLIEGEEGEVAENFKKQLKKSARAQTKTARETQDLPAMEPESPMTRLDPGMRPGDEEEDREETVEVKRAAQSETVESAALNVVAPSEPARAFDERRTDPLPLVSIDIERLLHSTFSVTSIGLLALSNESLDDLIKQVLSDCQKGKSLLLVLTDSARTDSAVLATYRYCLDRGYIEHSDTVMSLTVDLLLGRLELEQYLLQRRRITGDQIRDLVAISNRQGLPLGKLLVAAGYMLPVDMERVKKEQERFSPR